MTISFSRKDLLSMLQVTLLVAVLVLLLISKPWSDDATAGVPRTIAITGEATVSAEPDEFIFYPSYQFTADSNDAVLADISSKSEEVIEALKDRGVEDSKIEVNAGAYESYYRDEDGRVRGSLSLTVAVASRDKAQEIQDYLLTTSVEGSITPRPSISKESQDKLEQEARSAAIADAKSKAERTAEETGNKIGKIISIDDTESAGQIVYPYSLSRGASLEIDASSSSIPVQPGEDEVNYSLDVVFEVK